MSGFIGITGREITETRWDGDLCNSSHHHVLHHVGPPYSQDHIILICIHISLQISTLSSFYDASLQRLLAETHCTSRPYWNTIGFRVMGGLLLVYYFVNAVIVHV